MSTPLHDPGTHANLTRAETIKELRELLERNILEMTEARRHIKPTDEGAVYVVVSTHGLAIDYDQDEHGHLVNARPGKVHRVLRMSQADATRVAKGTHDGTGEPMHATHIAQAIDKELESLGDLLEKALTWAAEEQAKTVN
jgi:hypothetical protein